MKRPICFKLRNEFQLFMWAGADEMYHTTLVMRVLRECATEVGLPHPYHHANLWYNETYNQQKAVDKLRNHYLVEPFCGPRNGARWKATPKGVAVVEAVERLGPSPELHSTLILMDLGFTLRGDLRR